MVTEQKLNPEDLIMIPNLSEKSVKYHYCGFPPKTALSGISWDFVLQMMTNFGG